MPKRRKVKKAEKFDCPIRCPPRFPPVTHIIFELDVLLDNDNLFMSACQRVLDEYEYELSFECRTRGGAMDPESFSELIVNKYKLDITPEVYLIKHNEYYTDLVANPELAPGAEHLIRHMHKFCIPMAVVTSMKKANLEPKLYKHCELFQLIKNIVCIDDEDVRHPKPESDLFQIAASRFCGDPCCNCCLIFDKTERGLWAANEAQMQCIMVVDESMPCCYTETAALRIESLEQFIPEEFCLPAYNCVKYRPCACMGIGCS